MVGMGPYIGGGEMIKFEDITDELIESIEKGVNTLDTRKVVAEILNTAIEAGLVSPPVYVIRDNSSDHFHAFMITKDEIPKYEHIGAIEHWKGQTQ